MTYLVERLVELRNVLIHEYIELDLRRAVEALHQLEPIDQFAEIVRRIEEEIPDS